ncbi:MAG: adenosylcobinamide-phosphate synthase CbiB [Methylococcales bacterium]
MFELAALAYLIDCCVGELPGTHPVVLMGNYINWYEKSFYRDHIGSGALLVISLLTLTLLLSALLVYACQLLPNWLALPALAILASTGLAMHMLHASVAAILTAPDPKQVLRYLVSRDTEHMTSTDIYKAGLETWAENLSDGVIAPLFYLLWFGLPGLALYKAINTLDSMVAYKTERYFYFGKTAARLDDLANFIPARLTALLIVGLAKHKQRAWQCVCNDGYKLESPNAGYPIAAMAGALGVSLGGAASYHGQIKTKANIGDALYPVTIATLEAALAMKPAIDFVILSLLAVGIYFNL